MTLTWTTFALAALLLAALFAAAFARQSPRGTRGQYLAAFAAVQASGLILFLLVYQPRPGEALVETVERHLAAHPCTAPLERRWREYRYANGGNGNADRRWVTFVLLDGGDPGRAIFGVREGWPAGKGLRLVARGRYEILSDRLSVDYCGVSLGARHRT